MIAVILAPSLCPIFIVLGIWMTKRAREQQAARIAAYRRSPESHILRLNDSSASKRLGSL